MIEEELQKARPKVVMKLLGVSGHAPPQAADTRAILPNSMVRVFKCRVRLQRWYATQELAKAYMALSSDDRKLPYCETWCLLQGKVTLKTGTWSDSPTMQLYMEVPIAWSKKAIQTMRPSIGQCTHLGQQGLCRTAQKHQRVSALFL